MADICEPHCRTISPDAARCIASIIQFCLFLQHTFPPLMFPKTVFPDYIRFLHSNKIKRCLIGASRRIPSSVINPRNSERIVKDRFDTYIRFLSDLQFGLACCSVMSWIGSLESQSRRRYCHRCLEKSRSSKIPCCHWDVGIFGRRNQALRLSLTTCLRSHFMTLMIFRPGRQFHDGIDLR